MSTPLLRLSDISHRFPDGTTALADISADIAAGSFVSLVGPSGCGKSTLLRLIAGLDLPSSGQVIWSGSIPQDVGFVFQDATLMPWASVADNVWLPHRLRGMSRDEAQPLINEALDRVGLGGRHAAYPRELSGGMRMRVSIARALSLRPRVLLMDEPFAALDEITREKLNDDLNDLWAEHKWTVIYVTHSVYEAAFLSTRILVLPGKPGRLVADAQVEAPAVRDDSWRADPHFAQISADVTGHLRSAAAHADAKRHVS
ncbi:MAG: ABC transporter ATP-binding protein [Candidatus Phaeomarinobacter sp.]